MPREQSQASVDHQVHHWRVSSCVQHITSWWLFKVYWAAWQAGRPHHRGSNDANSVMWQRTIKSIIGGRQGKAGQGTCPEPGDGGQGTGD